MYMCNESEGSTIGDFAAVPSGPAYAVYASSIYDNLDPHDCERELSKQTDHLLYGAIHQTNFVV